MSNKAVLRVAKIKSTRALRGALSHNLRVQETPNADHSKTGLNWSAKGMKTIDECMNRYSGLIGSQTVRKNAVHAIEVVVSGSPERMHEMSKNERTEYFNDSLKWLSSQFGGNKNLVSVVIHEDEQTPHMQVIYTPIDEKGKLNARAFIGGHRGRMTELQSEFANEVSIKHGLERGIKGSKATHATVKEYYRATQELESVKHELSQAKYELANVKKMALEALERHFKPLVDTLEHFHLTVDVKSLLDVQREISQYDNSEVKKVLPSNVKSDIEQAISPFRRI
jgi:hypothetical protein